MFYSVELLTKKGVLSKIWLSANNQNLNKKAIMESNVSEMCVNISKPVVALSMRLQALLLHGLMKIFNKQVTYLLNDAQEILSKKTKK